MGDAAATLDVAVLGAGFGGLAAAIGLVKAGNRDFAVLDAADGVGGTWRANTYPGAACDVMSHLYSLRSTPKKDWSRTYATQPEILAYLDGVADRWGLRQHLRPRTRVVTAAWQEGQQCWQLTCADGSVLRARVVICALGLLSRPAVPDLAGLTDFTGPVCHTAAWDLPDEAIAGHHVAVVGTGASSVQVVPALARVAASVTVLQRSPAWVLPKLDRPHSPEELRRFTRLPMAARVHRWRTYWRYERSTTFRTGEPKAGQLTALALSYLERKIPDPELRAALTPDYPLGCKRILVSTAFYKALALPHVRLVTAPIETFTATGIRTADGSEHRVDAVVLATGFTASEHLAGLEVTGRGGRRLHEDWREGAYAHLGITVDGYPNLFLMYGPGTNQGGNSIVFLLECQARYIVTLLLRARRRGVDTLEVRARVVRRYDRRHQRALAGTVWATGGCSSYFRNAAGTITTQLPHTSLWYWSRTRWPRWGAFRATKAGARDEVPA